MPDSIRTLDYVILLCDDLAAMRAFYEQRLGLPVVRDWENWLELGAGAVRLTLRPRGRPYDGPRVSPGAGVQLAFRVSPGEVAAWQAGLEAAGVEVLESARPGLRPPNTLCPGPGRQRGGDLRGYLAQ